MGQRNRPRFFRRLNAYQIALGHGCARALNDFGLALGSKFQGR